MPNFKHMSNPSEGLSALQNWGLKELCFSGKVSAVSSVKLARFTDVRTMEQL